MSDEFYDLVAGDAVLESPLEMEWKLVYPIEANERGDRDQATIAG